MENAHRTLAEPKPYLICLNQKFSRISATFKISFFQYECDPRDDMDSYQELCYEVGLDLEPNKYAKLRKQAMLAQEEQNDPMPWPLLFIDEICLKMKVGILYVFNNLR